uniref:Syndecan n=1 Tax=Strigamia maritima TaxID=126957 RepID=T1J3J8_STRMM
MFWHSVSFLSAAQLRKRRLANQNIFHPKMIYLLTSLRSDMIDDSAVDQEFTDLDEYSGNGPDDEDGGISGSGRTPTDSENDDDDDDGMLEGSGVSPDHMAAVIPTQNPVSITVQPITETTTTSTTTTTTTVTSVVRKQPEEVHTETTIPITETTTTSTTTTTTTVTSVVRKQPEEVHTETTITNINGNHVPGDIPKTNPDKHPPVSHDNNDTPNEIPKAQRADEQAASFFAQPGILAAVIGGAVVGLLCAILLVMFIVYRMRKKDEGSYPLDEPKRSPTGNSYARNTNKEFYA